MKEFVKPSLMFLDSFLKYASLLYSEEERFDSQPEKILARTEQSFFALGELEALRLKGWGLESNKWTEYFLYIIQVFRYKILGEIELDLPLVGKKIYLENMVSLEDFEEVPTFTSLPYESWCTHFLTGFLNTYSHENLHWKKISQTPFILEGQPTSLRPYTAQQGEIEREFVHDCNNLLGGIISFASLLQLKGNSNEIAGSILESSKKLHSLIQQKFPKTNT